MKVFSRIGFVSLTAGAFGLPVAILIPYSHAEIADKFGFIGFFCLFGLQIWSVIFLKSEPTLRGLGCSS